MGRILKYTLLGMMVTATICCCEVARAATHRYDEAAAGRYRVTVWYGDTDAAAVQPLDSTLRALSTGAGAAVPRTAAVPGTGIPVPPSIRRISITGYTSIDGGYPENERLARARAREVELYIFSHYPNLSGVTVDVDWVAEDWEGLSRLIRSSDLDEWEEVLEIIRKVQDPDTREGLLKKLNGGMPYIQMEEEMFPLLERVEVEVEVEIAPSAPSGHLPLAGEELAAPSDLSGSQDIDADADATFALKTNLLLWAGVQADSKLVAPVANVSLEYYLSNLFSIEIGARYSYWRYNHNREFQGISGYRIEPRYRIGSPGGGFGGYIGPYFRLGDYDFQTISKGSAGSSTAGTGSSSTTTGSTPQTLNYTGDYRDTGLSAGFFLRLAGQWGLETGIRVGYVSTEVMHYDIVGTRNKFTHQERYGKIRITDLGVTLVYRIR